MHLLRVHCKCLQVWNTGNFKRFRSYFSDYKQFQILSCNGGDSGSQILFSVPLTEICADYQDINEHWHHSQECEGKNLVITLLQSFSHLKHRCCWGSRFTSVLCIHNWCMNAGHNLAVKTLWKEASPLVLVFVEIIPVWFWYILIPLDVVTIPYCYKSTFLFVFQVYQDNLSEKMAKIAYILCASKKEK